jgi:hypothetical protein
MPRLEGGAFATIIRRSQPSASIRIETLGWSRTPTCTVVCAKSTRGRGSHPLPLNTVSCVRILFDFVLIFHSICMHFQTCVPATTKPSSRPNKKRHPFGWPAHRVARKLFRTEICPRLLIRTPTPAPPTPESPHAPGRNNAPPHATPSGAPPAPARSHPAPTTRAAAETR